jgi:hypothetical protein
MPNAVIFARALFALHEAGVLRNLECKAAVKIFIRQSSEDRLWHLSTHYRSKQAAAIIAAVAHKSRSQYHAFCRKKENRLRHEHMVPGEVVYNLIINEQRPSVLRFARILRHTGYRATITVEEDGALLSDSMPEGYTDFRSPEYHLGRYIKAKIAIELEKRPPEGWFP